MPDQLTIVPDSSQDLGLDESSCPDVWHVTDDDIDECPTCRSFLYCPL